METFQDAPPPPPPKRKPPGLLVPVLFVVAVLAVFGVARYLMPGGVTSAAIARESAEHRAWNDAKAELKGNILTAFQKSPLAQTTDMPAADLEAVADCSARGMITFLNQTDCAYKYNTATETMEAHLAAQEACLKKVKSADQEVAIELACCKKHLSNDWNLIRTQTTKNMLLELQKNPDIPPEKLQTAASCLCDALVNVLKGSKCSFVRMDATTLTEILQNPDDCLKDPEVDAKYSAAAQACGRALGGEAAADPAGDVTPALGTEK